MQVIVQALQMFRLSMTVPLLQAAGAFVFRIDNGIFRTVGRQHALSMNYGATVRTDLDADQVESLRTARHEIGLAEHQFLESLARASYVVWGSKKWQLSPIHDEEKFQETIPCAKLCSHISHLISKSIKKFQEMQPIWTPWPA